MWIIYNEIALSLKFILCLNRALSTLLFQSDLSGIIDLVAALVAHGKIYRRTSEN